MVVQELWHAVGPLPDPRPTKADPEQRAKRKAHEKEHPHFQMQEFALKAGVLALMGAVAVYPWEKKYDEHVAKHHPERVEKDSGKESESKGERGERRRRYVEDDRRERRRMSVAGTAPRQRAYVAEGSRRESVGAAMEGGGSRGRRHVEEVRTTERRRNVDPVALRLAVAEGYSYVPDDKGYIDGNRSADADWDRRPREFVQNDYVFRPSRSASDRRR